ncbi:MAG TPA: hypothetical protein VFX95_10005 [Caulobacteraceae bacterium]|nr:hypothetical protein [Caulobacteraceae bacterium]
MRCWKNARRSSRAPEFAVVAALLLAACGEPATAPAPPPATEPVVLPPVQAPADTHDPAPPGAPAPAVLGWSHESSGEGNALVLREDNADLVRIACIRGKGLVVHGEGFKHVESEERMSVGAGNTVVTMVATADGDGVKGEGPIDADFIRAVGEGRKIAVNYGYQNMGPFNGPPANVAALFAAGCRDGGG